MRVFIVHAHPEPNSFNGALTLTAVEALRAAGHGVVVSDLDAMDFDPVSDGRNFRARVNPVRLKLQDEEDHASRTRGFIPELQVEMDKLAACDVLILQFPLWWLGLPARLKGWVDRVFAAGVANGGGRYYDKGVFRGKRALLSVTIGGPAGAYSADGMYGPLEPILYPIHHGILAFTGFEVLEPFVVHAPARASAEERKAHLFRWRERVLGLAGTSHGDCALNDVQPAARSLRCA